MSTAYLFPGQGSHEVGMGQDLFDRYDVARRTYEEADDLLGFPLSTLCFEGPLDQLTDTVNQQPALFVTSIAMLRVLRETEGAAPPSFAAGHSLGELSALAAVGSLDFADGVRLVRARGEAMQAAGEAQPGSMAAVLGLDADTVAVVCGRISQEGDHLVQLANDNCPGQIVISGHEKAVELATEALQVAGARKVVQLPITIAAHSPLMGGAAASFTAAVAETDFAPPSIPVIANTSATALHTAADIRQELENQLTGPVRWSESMALLVENGVTEMVEVGPGDVLQKLMKRIDRKVNRQGIAQLIG